MKKRLLTMMMALCLTFTSLPAEAAVYTGVADTTEVVVETTEEESTAVEPRTETEETEVMESGETEGPEGTGQQPEGTGMEETETVTENTEISEEPVEGGTENIGTEDTQGPVSEEITTEEISTEETEELETEEILPVEIPTEETEVLEAEELETEEIPTEEVTEEETEETEEAALNFVMVESSEVTTPGTQNIVASVGTEEMDLENPVLIYKDLTTGKEYRAQAAARAQDMMLFAVEFSETGDSGEYQLVGISYQEDGIEHQIEMAGLEMDVRFGVNTSVETEPDQVLAEEAALADVDADVVTMDENGEIISENTVEDVLNNGIDGEAITKSSMIKGASGNLVVVLDPGHDDSHTGASYYGAKEQELVLKIAQYCREELNTYSGVTVYMTRESGACPNGGSSVTSGTCNEARVAYAKSVGANVYVSFHLNASASSSANGVGIYYPNSNYRPDIGEVGKGLATSIYNKLTALGLKQWSDGTMIWNANTDKYDDGSAADYLGVIRNSKLAGIPAVLIEHAFISGTSDFNNFLSSDEKLKTLGVADATAIAEYYGLKKKSSKPEITYTQSRSDGSLKIQWGAVADASYYEVWRDTKNAYSYQKIAEVSDATSYFDKDVKAGTKYYYLIRAVYEDSTTSDYSEYATGCALEQPEISYIKSESSKKIEIAWEKVSGAEGYLIFRENNDTGKYEQVKKITSANTLTYVDEVKSNNKSYSYKIQAYNTNNGKQGVSKYSEVKSGKAVGKPTVTSVISQEQNTLEITWKKVSGASGYVISRSTKKGSGFKKIATVSGGSKTSYEDDSVKKATTYYYKVQAYNENDGITGYSGYSSAVSGKTVAKTKITSVVSYKSTSLKVSWKKVSDAYGYRVKRSTSKNGTYKVIKTVKSKNTTTYTDNSVKTGTTYYYKVETIAKNNGSTGYSGDSAAVSGKTAAKTKINYVVSNGSRTLEINWQQVSGAYGYRVKRSTSRNGTYKIVATITGKSKTTYKDAGLTAGKTYYYRVEVINKVNGKKGYSGNSASASGKTLKTTTITSVKAQSSTSMSLTWKKVSGATGYQIYRSTKKSSGFQKIATVGGAGTVTYKDTGLSAGKTYYYKVRACKVGSKKTGVASFSKVQKAWTLKKVEISQVESAAGDAVTLKWNKVSNASGYTVYRSSSPSSGFKKIAGISSGNTLTYTDKTVETGNVYYYRIAANNKITGNKMGRGDYSDTLAVPVLSKGRITSVSYESGEAFNISWKMADGADGYQLYYSLSQNSGYKMLATTSDTSYMHNGLTEGATYYYKVRAYVKLDNGSTLYGDWSAVKSQAAAHEIMGTSSVTVAQMTSYYNARYTFPSAVYAGRGASTAEQFFTILKEEADAEGVKAEVLFAQVMLETGGLKFGGDVAAEQCNFGGLGATGNGVSGETFADVRTGLRAQTQHLKAYASTAALNNSCVDSRFQYVTRGCAPYVEWLAIPQNPYGKGWAADADYGTKLLKIINSL